MAQAVLDESAILLLCVRATNRADRMSVRTSLCRTRSAWLQRHQQRSSSRCRLARSPNLIYSPQDLQAVVPEARMTLEGAGWVVPVQVAESVLVESVLAELVGAGVGSAPWCTPSHARVSYRP